MSADKKVASDVPRGTCFPLFSLFLHLSYVFTRYDIHPCVLFVLSCYQTPLAFSCLYILKIEKGNLTCSMRCFLFFYTYNTFIPTMWTCDIFREYLKFLHSIISYCFTDKSLMVMGVKSNNILFKSIKFFYLA